MVLGPGARLLLGRLLGGQSLPGYLCQPHPLPATSCLSYVGSWVPWAGFCGQEPFSLCSVGEALASLHSPPLGRGWLRKREGEAGGGSWYAGVNVCYKGSCLLASPPPHGAPSHLPLPRSSQYYSRLCVCFQPGEEVEPDGRRIG